MKVLKLLDENFEKYILMLLLSIMTLVMGVQVIARYVFNNSLTWSEELVRYLFVWSAFLSLPYTIKTGIAISIDQVVNILPEVARKSVKIVSNVLMIIFFIFMFQNSIGVVQSSIISGQRTPALGLPMFLIQASALVGFALGVIRTIQVTINTIKSPKEKEA